MKLSITKIGGAAFLSAALCGSALAQSLTSLTSNPSTQQIQNMTHTMEKVAIVGAGVGLGVTVLTLALHHHHHSVSASNSDGTQALAAAYARAQHEAAMSSFKPAAETAPAPEPKPVEEIKGTNLSAAALVQPQPGLWSWQEVVGSNR
jgi:hypothetical protein